MQWSLDIVCCVLRQCTLSTLSQFTSLRSVYWLTLAVNLHWSGVQSRGSRLLPCVWHFINRRQAPALYGSENNLNDKSGLKVRAWQCSVGTVPVHPLTCTSWSLSLLQHLPWWRPRGVPVWLGTPSVGSGTPAVVWWLECYPYPDAAYVGWCKSPKERIVNSEHTKISIIVQCTCIVYLYLDPTLYFQLPNRN